MLNKCPKCNTDNSDTLKFCGECGTQLPSSEDINVTKTIETPKEELTRGTTFANRYEIIEELGKGGMGKVYRVEDKKIKQEIALKLIKPEIASDKKTIERFKNELTTARKIAHRNVCRMFDLGEEKEQHFITMEYVRGGDLKRLIRRTKRLDTGTAISIVKQICEGLSEAHELGIVHRDLKPNNIMIDDNGNARIMDFGIARSIRGKGITGSGIMIGTPEYMSPEQVEAKDIDQRSDIYSLGIIMYEMLTGRCPFEADTPFAIGVKQKSEIPKSPKEYNPQISDDLNRVILKCLEKDKENRYQSANEVRSELGKIELGLPTTDRVVPKKKTLSSEEITVQFKMRKIFIPAVVVLAIVAVGLMIWSPWKQRETSPILSEKPSIAVLPFEDSSPQKDQGVLCDGIPESIIIALSRVENIHAPAPTSSFSFRGKDIDLKEIGEKLKVRTVLTGSLQKDGNRIRIRPQLINIADDSLLWTEQYDRELEDIFAIQDEITFKIIEMLRVNLLGEEKDAIVKRYTENIEAYNLYLQGRFFWNKRTEEGLNKAIEYFQQAIEVDPNYALSYSGLADSYFILSDYGYLSSIETKQKVKEAAKKALEIDDRLAEAYTSSAVTKLYFDWDLEGGTKDFEKAIQLNPNYGTAHQWYANCLSVLAQKRDAVNEAKRARELDPLSPIINRNVGRRLYIAREYDDAIEESLNALKIAPDFFPIFNTLGLAYIKKGMMSEAVEVLKKAVDLSDSNVISVSSLGYAYAIMGRKNEAKMILNDLIERSKFEYVPSMEMAKIYVGLGDFDRAIEYLEKAYDEHVLRLINLKIEPVFESLYSDSRFRSLLKRIGLEE